MKMITAKEYAEKIDWSYERVIRVLRKDLELDIKRIPGVTRVTTRNGIRQYMIPENTPDVRMKRGRPRRKEANQE